MTKEELLNEIYNYMKNLNSDEIEKFISDIMQITLTLALGDCLSTEVKDVLYKNKEEVH